MRLVKVGLLNVLWNTLTQEQQEWWLLTNLQKWKAKSGIGNATSHSSHMLARSLFGIGLGITEQESKPSLDSVPFYRECSSLEKIWTGAGINIIKFWYSVNKREQARRFKERETHPLKQGKLSEIDLISQDKWEEYTKAKNRMFKETENWIQVKSNCKRSARIASMQYVLLNNDYEGRDLSNIGDINTDILKEI